MNNGPEKLVPGSRHMCVRSQESGVGVGIRFTGEMTYEWLLALLGALRDATGCSLPRRSLTRRSLGLA